jgi:hypothetical protein
MKKQTRKLRLAKETITRLGERDLGAAHGASAGDFTCNTCTSLDCATSNGPVACLCLTDSGC